MNPPLAIPAGNHQLTFHEAAEGLDPFAFQCGTPPLYPPTSLSVEPGGRYHLFAYTLPGGTELQTLVLPVAE